jgi:acylphosphatase
MARKILRLRIRGRVQGVGFRAFVADEAQMRGLAGWVRNRRDGSVEALFAGESETLDEIVASCRRGPNGARVEDLAIEAASESDIAGASSVEILRTI